MSDFPWGEFVTFFLASGSSSNIKASLVLLLQAKSWIIIMAPVLCGEGGWRRWWWVCGVRVWGGVNIVNGNCGLSVSLLTTERTYFSWDWNNNYCCLFNWLQTAPFIRNDVVCVMLLRASFIQYSGHVRYFVSY